MATSNGNLDLHTGPFQCMMEAYFGGLDTAAKSMDPVVKSMAQANLEAAGLCSRRAQSYLEIASRISACRTPHEIMAEQLRFWQTAMGQYQDSSRKIMALWSRAIPEMPFATTETQKPSRDYITFPEASEASQEAAGRRAA